MYGNEKPDFEQFKEWYGDTFYAEVSQFEEKEPHLFQFLLKYRPQNLPEQFVRMRMKVDGGKLTFVSGEFIWGNQTVEFQDMLSFIKWAGGYLYVVLDREGRTIEVDKSEVENQMGGDDNAVVFFRLPAFSPSDNYLTYGADGWEWETTRIYDIKNGRKIPDGFSNGNFGFIDNEKYLYGCGATAGRDGLFGKVYNTSDLSVKYELPQGGGNKIVCSFDEGKRIVTFTITTLEVGKISSYERTNIFEYSPDTDQVTEK
jgi:hypothetical protein